MKALTGIVLSMVLVMGLFTACGQSGSSTGGNSQTDSSRDNSSQSEQSITEGNTDSGQADEKTDSAGSLKLW